VRIGWLTPLLGLFLLLDLLSFWLIAWDIRELVRIDYPSLLGMLVIVGTYYLAASLIFPDCPEEWPDFDRWYDRQNRMALGGMLAANLISILYQFALEADASEAQIEAQLATLEQRQLSDLAILLIDNGGLLVAALLVALIVVKNRLVNLFLLGLLILLTLATHLIEHVPEGLRRAFSRPAGPPAHRI